MKLHIEAKMLYSDIFSSFDIHISQKSLLKVLFGAASAGSCPAPEVKERPFPAERAGKSGAVTGCGKLYRARSRLYRNEILQENMRWKTLAEIYKMHSFALFLWDPFSKLIFFV